MKNLCIFRILIYTLIIFILVHLYIYIFSKLIILRYPVSLQRQKIIWSTPIGTDKNRVKKYIAEQKYRLDYDISSQWVDGTYPHRNIGSSYIRAYLGYYYSPLRADVITYWIFDEQNEVIEIIVEKQYDSF